MNQRRTNSELETIKMNKAPNSLEEDDEEENEIQRLILNNQQHLEKGNSLKMTQSFSAHANLVRI